MKKRVLIVGSDATLLNTRHDILRANGIEAATKLVGSVPLDLLASAGAHLIIACSSLSSDAQQTIVALSRKALPPALCLVVEPTSSTWTANPEPDAIVPGLDGPQKFVSVVQAVLSA